MPPLLRKVLMLAATVFALATPAIQALTGWGLSAQEFSNPGDETLRAAAYAFSIWGLIYAGLAAQAGFHLFAGPRHEPLLQRLSLAIVAIAGCGAWLLASAANVRWLTVVIIVLSAASAWWALHRAKGQSRGRPAAILAVWPIALLGGWLLVASVINVLTVATAEGLITPAAAPPVALASIAGAALLAIIVIGRGVCALYGVPVAWGLAAVYVAERADQPAAAYAALGAAVLVLVVTIVAAVKQLRISRRT